MVNQRGIKVNLEKFNSIEGMKSLTCHKEVQTLNERLAALSSFLAKACDKSLPFFQVLGANKKFEWMPECKEAFQDLKQKLGDRREEFLITSNAFIKDLYHNIL